ncbi:hypothetical protein PTTG_11719 [Puccinia triticina 1-1 BBBD Race 1]|uniref:Secreted protein n=2 Tax=Puccinia triticina TaxID=208348 RepID=A0A180H503_PUCT1|nr:uncharacterized protein PtA15_2A482 [Puccinia triticina]OAV99669.1 hypothetical protein PTTG_11719 [Puccinia triticina 1-1 BBBD Race 1]WAQ82167.1 hypothetical protein PtA15_2A482 [Puccinia triticina]WAR53022.1 hypothetical protein PtB15_2B450 [Puccinia triticina]
MFSASSIWKLYVLSAVIALVSLPPVELAEVQRHAFSRRGKENDKPPPAPLKNGDPALDIRCGDSWNTVANLPKDKDGKEQIACRGYDGLGYYCLSETCKYGSITIDYVPFGFSLSDWRFLECTRYPYPTEIDPATKKPPPPITVKTLSPIGIWAHNIAGYMAVTGWDDEKNPPDKTTRNYRCTWTAVEDVNNQRPVCTKCTRQDFKESTPPDVPVPDPKEKGK